MYENSEATFDGKTLRIKDNQQIITRGMWDNIPEYIYEPIEVIIPNMVVEIWDYAFQNHNYIREIVIPDSVLEIGFGAFSHCTRLKEVILSRSLRKIHSYAFSDCYNIENITLPNGIIAIGDNAFSYCYNIKKIEIPSTVEVLSKNIFWKCYRLKEIRVSQRLIDVYGEDYISSNTFAKVIPLDEGIIGESINSQNTDTDGQNIKSSGQKSNTTKKSYAGVIRKNLMHKRE